MSPRIRWTGLLAGLLLLALCAPAVHSQALTAPKWVSSVPHESQAFGSAVAIEGDLAAVGAPGYDPAFSVLDEGAAYVYRFDGSAWVEEQLLKKPQPALGDFFGRSVAFAAVDMTDGLSNTLLVGMQQDEDVESGGGAAYVYQLNGGQWEHTATLSASDGADGDSFSHAIAGDFDGDGDVNGADFLIGAPRHNLTGFNREGAAYMYRYEDDAWTEVAKLTASDPFPSADFGESVALSGNRALVGAPGDDADGVGQNAGVVYVFEYEEDQWVETAKLTAFEPFRQSDFGASVAIDGDWALIGARRDSQADTSSGAAYIFRYNGTEWVEHQKLKPEDYDGLMLFGTGVALEDGLAVVGAPHWLLPDVGGTGKAYLYTYNADEDAWEEQDGLVPDDVGPGDGFGSALAVSNGVILVGSPSHGDPVGGNGAVYVAGDAEGTSAEDIEMPLRVILSPAAPNPSRTLARLTLTLDRTDRVRVSLFDLLGREVHVLYDGVLAAATPRILTVETDALPSGLYIVRAATPSRLESRTVVVQR